MSRFLQRCRRMMCGGLALLFMMVTAMTAHAAPVSGPLPRSQPIPMNDEPHPSSVFQIEARLPVPLGSWCFDAWTQTTSYAYLADANNAQIDVVNLRTMQLERPIGTGLLTGPANCTSLDFTQMGPSGLVIDRHQHLWASNGASSVFVFDLRKQGHLLTTLHTGGHARTDGIAYDPTNDVVLVANPDEAHPFISLIDAKDFRVLAVLPVASAEAPVWDAAYQRFLLSMPGTATGTGGGIAVLPITFPFHLRISQFLPVPACAPAGLTLGPQGQALVGCHLGGARLVQTRSGKILSVVDSASVDLVSFAAGRYALATITGPSTPGEVDVLDERGDVLQRIATAPLSHSVLLLHTFGRTQLLIPEKGKGIVVYEEQASYPFV